MALANINGIHLDEDSSAQVQANQISNNTGTGILLSGSSSGFEADSTWNCLRFNTTGVNNTQGNTVVFEDNWWGATDGPMPGGSGASVSPGVDFDPFLGTPPTGCGLVPVELQSFSVE